MPTGARTNSFWRASFSPSIVAGGSVAQTGDTSSIAAEMGRPFHARIPAPHSMPAPDAGPFHGTFGSFGMSGAEVRLPGGFIFEYPNGQSTDISGVVQLDSDDRLEGGVRPDIRVPLTMETVHAAFVDKRDVVMAYGIRALQELASSSSFRGSRTSP